MNVDLFFRNGGGVCFLFDSAPTHPLKALVYDERVHQFYLEFGHDAPSFLLNIPVNAEAAESLSHFARAHIGLIENSTIKEALNMPILHMAQHMSDANQRNVGGGRDVSGLQDILHNCHFAQAVHREDFGNEESANSILGDAQPALVAFSPAMQKTLSAERRSAPQFEPSAPTLHM
jgi:hypothetical protein